MATSSLTKEFTIKDPKVYERFIKITNKPVEKKEIQTSYLEEGKRLLAQYLSR